MQAVTTILKQRHASVRQTGYSAGRASTSLKSRPMNQKNKQTMNNKQLQLWGGLECTVNRVSDEYLSQMERNGHAVRDDDLERFASLGIQAIRYPILWERTAPDGVDRADWSWPDERLRGLRGLGITPIVGLVHHGSGPRHTSLIDPGFAEQLAEFAGAVAQRYHWVHHYTPVNEPHHGTLQRTVWRVVSTRARRKEPLFKLC
jgi:beta-glucosidase/6-phospho-beta-glucosidase/beta-galactosidase